MLDDQHGNLHNFLDPLRTMRSCPKKVDHRNSQLLGAIGAGPVALVSIKVAAGSGKGPYTRVPDIPVTQPYPGLEYICDPELFSQVGYLKAVWPDLLGCVLEVWPSPGAGQTSKTHPQKKPSGLP